MKNQNIQQITNNVNECITKKDSAAKSIRAVKKLLSDDIAIHTIDKEKAVRLRDNDA